MRGWLRVESGAIKDRFPIKTVQTAYGNVPRQTVQNWRLVHREHVERDMQATPLEPEAVRLLLEKGGERYRAFSRRVR